MDIRRVIESGVLRAAACALLLGMGEPAIAAPEVTFFCGFEQSPRDCGFTEQAKAAGQSMVRSGYSTCFPRIRWGGAGWRRQ
jgi:hypothetical protein